MAATPSVLYRSAGNFLRIRGTERFIHYSRLFPHQLQSDTEFWELCGIRVMRQVLADARAAGAAPADVVGVEQTLSMLCGAILRQVLEASPPGKAAVFGNCTIAMELEALKILRPGTPGGQPTPVDLVLGSEAPEETRTLARFLHQDIDDLAQHYPIRSIAPGPLRLDEVDPDAAILFLNHVRHGLAEGPEALRSAVAHHRSTGMPVLVLLRTSEEAPWHGQSVNGTTVEVPSHYALLDVIAQDGVRGAHAFVEGFDRDFLLPPNDGCGLGLILLSRDEAHLQVPGFQRFPQAQASGTRQVAIWGGAERRNYAMSLNFELPEVAAAPEWDWEAFKREHDDTLTAEELAGNPSRATGSLLAYFMSTLDNERLREFPRFNEAILTVRRQCEAGELPWGGALVLARTANQDGVAPLAWQAVTTALLDLSAYGMSAETAFRRAERAFGAFLVNLREPQVGQTVADANRSRATTPFARTQLAALRATCALRCDAPERLLMAASDLLQDPEWASTAYLMISYARERMASGSPPADPAALLEGRTPSPRDRKFLAFLTGSREEAPPPSTAL